MTKPILYTFRRCPYAIRARMSLQAAQIDYEPREIELKNKPAPMLSASPKGTVPVLILDDGTVIDESFDIMLWALQLRDPLQWLPTTKEEKDTVSHLVYENDTSFKRHLDAYKYHINQIKSADELRDGALPFLNNLNLRLIDAPFLLGKNCSIADVAIFPFIRQFRGVDTNWFDSSKLNALRAWLATFINGDLFKIVMQK